MNRTTSNLTLQEVLTLLVLKQPHHKITKLRSIKATFYLVTMELLIEKEVILWSLFHNNQLALFKHQPKIVRDKLKQFLNS